MSTVMRTERQLVSVMEASRVLGVSRTAIRALINSGTIRTVTIPGFKRRLIPLSELRRWLAGEPQRPARTPRETFEGSVQ